MKKIESFILKLIKNVWAYYLYLKYKRLYNKDPKLAADCLYYKINGKHIDFNAPKSLIEKIVWLSLNTDTSLWTKCADKYRMRDYVAQKGFGDYLPLLYGHWDDPDKMNINDLPRKFVLKANNGCATVLIVKDKTIVDQRSLVRVAKKWMSRPFGYIGAEKHYLSIQPCIIAEELISQAAYLDELSPVSLVDFKVWCFNGVPECIWVGYDRRPDGLRMALYDTEWNSISYNLKSTKKDVYDPSVSIPRPKHLKEMLEIASSLSAVFKEVRVDFYETETKPIVGELTFTTGYGYFTDSFYEYLGSKISLPID